MLGNPGCRLNYSTSEEHFTITVLGERVLSACEKDRGVGSAGELGLQFSRYPLNMVDQIIVGLLGASAVATVELSSSVAANATLLWTAVRTGGGALFLALPFRSYCPRLSSAQFRANDVRTSFTVEPECSHFFAALSQSLKLEGTSYIG